MIRNTHQLHPKGTIVAYSDNSAVMAGCEAETWAPQGSDYRYEKDTRLVHTLMKVETHNHPTAIAPFPGASTGAGGEIQLTDGISALLAEEQILAYRYDGVRYDCGSKAGYMEATVRLGLRHPEVGPEFKKLLEKIVNEEKFK
jgi:hypothetical protein